MVPWLVLGICGLVAYFIYDAYRKNAYWREKGVPAPFLYPVVGRFLEQIYAGQGKFDYKWTQKLGRKFGLFDGPVPVIVISDTEMLKNVMVKDFSHFVNRREIEGINGPIIDQAVSVLKDQRWKDVRSVLVPTFTSGKMRMMNPLIQECSQTLIQNMDKMAENGQEFEAKEMFGRVTLDVIASAFFATKIDSQKDPNSDFVRHARKAFDFNFTNPLLIAAFLFPKLVPLLVKLGFQGFSREVTDFFVRNTEEIVRMRNASQDHSRKDFLQLMLNSLKGQSPVASKATKEATETTVRDDTDADHADILSDVLSNGPVTPEHNYTSNYKLTTEELVAQSVIFFLAGYETTATTLSFLTYCLTANPEIQERLREEIENVMGDREVPTYDIIAKMEYLDCCINETLRIYPPLARTERMCNETWTHKGLTVEKGSVVAIPIYAIHHDPEYWPDPETYNPDRFSHENKHNIKPYTFQTFGQGPRNCVGMRFAYYEIKLVMVNILRKFRFVPCSKTEIPLQITDVGFLRAKNGVWVKLEKLSA
ncbi:cytochrome P450 3A24-like [Paramacrobiotus metropolitanus]|uniref:cytochrome P450 3A24-like n=1 Tax=Paramacrobiotus metropolitanus TaxID=2943436 RepID=UPI002445D1E7|nr:cytochrome P450 3A24-like [Paramacrobiotus metropolitanus]